jgi:sensor histidine kinase regulating citrate/malate metabolism
MSTATQNLTESLILILLVLLLALAIAGVIYAPRVVDVLQRQMQQMASKPIKVRL